MKRLLFFICTATFGFSCTAFGAQVAPDTPSSITFFYNRAVPVVEIKQTAKMLLDGKGYIIHLPPNIDRASLYVEINKVPASQIYWPFDPIQPVTELGINNVPLTLPLIPEKEENPERRQLLSKLAALKAEETKLAGKIKATNDVITLWSNGFPQGANATPEDFTKLASSMTENISALTIELAKETIHLNETNRLLLYAQNELVRYDKANQSQVAHVFANSTETGQASVHYTYSMAAKSTPLYQVHALPEKDELRIEQSASVQLFSDVIWNNVDLSLAFASHELSPAPLLPWELSNASDLSPKAVLQPKKAVRKEELNMAPVTALFDGNTMKYPSPSMEEGSSFTLWKMGQHNLSPENLIVPLASTTHAAKYYYTIRPIQNRLAYLTAEVDFPEPVEMPSGMCSFTVDSMYFGKQMFAINGKSSVLYLGADPQIITNVKFLDNSEGEQGFIKTEKTKIWYWEVNVTNMRSRPVDIRIEDAEPVSNNKNIKINMTSTPTPKKEQPGNTQDSTTASELRLLIWNKTLKPQEKFTVNHKVEATFPNSLSISR